jgi:hypothetical protein
MIIHISRLAFAVPDAEVSLSHGITHPVGIFKRIDLDFRDKEATSVWYNKNK